MKVMNLLHRFAWAWGGLLVGLCVYTACFVMAPWYGYTCLVRPPEIPEPLDKLAQSAKSQSLFDLNGKSTMASEVSARVEFSYVKKHRSPNDSSPFVKSVSTSKEHPFLEIVVYGRSLEAARDYSRKVVDELREFYAPQVNDSYASVQKQLEILDERIKQGDELLQRTTEAGRRLGYSASLLDTAMGVERDLVTSRINRAQLANTISSQRLYNFQVVDAHAVDELKPVYPRKGLFAAVATVLSASLLFFFGGPLSRPAPVAKPEATVRSEERRSA